MSNHCLSLSAFCGHAVRFDILGDSCSVFAAQPIKHCQMPSVEPPSSEVSAGPSQCQVHPEHQWHHRWQHTLLAVLEAVFGTAAWVWWSPWVLTVLQQSFCWDCQVKFMPHWQSCLVASCIQWTSSGIVSQLSAVSPCTLRREHFKLLLLWFCSWDSSHHQHWCRLWFRTELCCWPAGSQNWGCLVRRKRRHCWWVCCLWRLEWKLLLHVRGSCQSVISSCEQTISHSSLKWEQGLNIALWRMMICALDS